MAELIVALDTPDAPSAVELLDQLPDGCAIKIGSVLMTAAGPGFVRGVVEAGHPVFLDLKWHDIPNTVRSAVESALQLGVEMVTVHALGGEDMVSSAVEAAGAGLKVVAVTILTSHGEADVSRLMGREIEGVGTEVIRLAEMAMGAGAHGLVCSPHEVELVAGIVGDRRIVVPGIRRSSDLQGDQVRTAGPAQAVESGATHLVVGRPITRATDPAAAWHQFAAEMGQV